MPVLEIGEILVAMCWFQHAVKKFWLIIDQLLIINDENIWSHLAFLVMLNKIPMSS